MQYPLTKCLLIFAVIFLIPITFISILKITEADNQILEQKVDSYASARLAERNDLMNGETRAIIITKLFSSSDTIEAFTIDTETFKSLQTSYMLFKGDQLLQYCRNILTRRCQITNDFDIKYVEKLRQDLRYPRLITIARFYLRDEFVQKFWELVYDLKNKCAKLPKNEGLVYMFFDQEVIRTSYIYFAHSKGKKNHLYRVHRLWKEHSIPFAKECALYMFSHYLQ
ncbi:hypothetical protein VCUG_02240 [Vavraia culicis subsp. floridensis]|uniref:Uncharacterized protein n=1 Tax=Vavraia culicis (isolate floridensis) TaxID=948595 RepID=L2GSK4_VAVCU|nr:uncharacterized protein VCUG_02240 [Vavraia culicis subsp. floridensis]ELA46273.1 hypothetical protein VCUG_02240 [Vavraia culicis subsp. floridensis]